MINVSAGLVPSESTSEANKEESTSESSFAQMLDEMMKQFEDASTTEKAAEFIEKVNETVELEKKVEDKKPTGLDKKPSARRRGVWKRVRVRPLDSFETAESQNIASHAFNAVNLDVPLKNIDKQGLSGKDLDTVDQMKGFKKDENRFNVDKEAEPINLDDLKPVESFEKEENIETVEITTILPEVTTTTKEPEIKEIEELNITTVSPIVEQEKEETTESAQIETTNAPEIPELQEIHEVQEHHEDIATESTTLNDEDYDLVFDTQANTEKSSMNADIFDDFKKSLKDLFAMDEEEEEEDDMEHEEEPYMTPSKMEYKTIDRVKVPESEPETVEITTTTETPIVHREVLVEDDPLSPGIVLATSTSTAVSHETEICYRGKCIKKRIPFK